MELKKTILYNALKNECDVGTCNGICDGCFLLNSWACTKKSLRSENDEMIEACINSNICHNNGLTWISYEIMCSVIHYIFESLQ